MGGCASTGEAARGRHHGEVCAALRAARLCQASAACSRPSGVVRLATRDKNRPSHPVSPCRHGRRGLLFAGMTNNHPSRIAGRPAVWAGNGHQPAGHPHNKRQERVGCQQPARFLLGYCTRCLRLRRMASLMRGGAVRLARLVHTQKAVSSNLTSATNAVPAKR